VIWVWWDQSLVN